MPYSINDFVNMGLYDEKAEQESCDTGDGKVIQRPNVSDKVKHLLRTTGADAYGGDHSRADSAVVTALLTAGYKPADVFSTFVASPRGNHAAERKAGHFEDYVKRTVEKAVGFLGTSSHVNVDFSKRKESTGGAGIVLSMGHEVETERTRWVWPGYIPAGKLTIIAGDPGMGKSTIVSDIVSRISKGTFLPSGKRSVTGTCLIASAEDSPEDTIVPRLIACDANLRRVGVIREVREDDIEGTHYLSFPRDLQIFRDLLIAKGVRVIIIDPLNAFLEKGTDTYKDQDMRLVLHPLEDIAEETGTAIVVVAHLNKKEDTSTLYRVGGSIGFIGAARSVLGVARTENQTRVLYSLKANLSARPPSLAYEIRQIRKQRKNGEWLGEAIINSSNIRWLGEVDFDPFDKNATSKGREDEESVEFLRQMLEDAGQVETDVLFREARQAGLSKTKLVGLRIGLHIRAVKRNDVWYWVWPDSQ